VRITCDPAKRLETLQERGLDMRRAGEVFAGLHLTRADDRFDYGERRYVTTGWLDSRLVVFVWTIRDDNGFPAPFNSDKVRAQPFWSSRSRVERIIESVPAYSGFVPHSIPWDEFVARWVPGLTKDGILTGVNWSGSRAVGYDIEPIALQRNVEAQIDA
jgi:uncharacterized DUF497 family protein